MVDIIDIILKQQFVTRFSGVGIAPGYFFYPTFTPPYLPYLTLPLLRFYTSVVQPMT